VSPASHVWFATVQVLATTTLTKVESILHEKPMAICDGMFFMTSASCAHNSPFVTSIWTFVPEQHPSSTTTLEHLELHQMPPSAKTPGGLPIAPPMQAIIVDCVPVVHPQLAAIIRENAKPVVACPEDSHSASPSHSKVVVSSKARPPATCVTIVDEMFPASHVWSASIQILASPTLPKIEGIFPEKAMAVSDGVVFPSLATCTHNHPSVCSVCTSVPE